MLEMIMTYIFVVFVVVPNSNQDVQLSITSQGLFVFSSFQSAGASTNPIRCLRLNVSASFTFYKTSIEFIAKVERTDERKLKRKRYVYRNNNCASSQRLSLLSLFSLNYFISNEFTRNHFTSNLNKYTISWVS